MVLSETDWLLQKMCGQQILRSNDLPTALLPGSFNPLHQGHLLLAQVASGILKQPVAFELSIANVDKAELDRIAIDSRLSQFIGQAPIYLTRAATFTMKARLFPGCVMIVGFDTAARIINPAYYHNSSAACLAALDFIQQQGCRFLVAGRVDNRHKFCSIQDLAIPFTCRDLFEPIDESAFRSDLSSSAIRDQWALQRERGVS